MMLVGKIINIKEKTTRGTTPYLVATVEIKCNQGCVQPDRNEIHTGKCVIFQDEV